jgi:hypothetical protein
MEAEAMIKRELPGAGERGKETAAAFLPQHTTLFYTISSNGLNRCAFIEEPVCT